jgi:phage terminase large subunit GpA-like protein
MGYEPTLVPSETPPSNNETVEQRIQELMKRQAQAVDAINRHVKGNGTVEKQYSIGDQVWLEGKHLKFPHQKTKINPKRY